MRWFVPYWRSQEQTAAWSEVPAKTDCYVLDAYMNDPNVANSRANSKHVDHL